MRLHPFALLIFASATVSVAPAQARLVADINQTVLGSASSNPTDFEQNGANVWFAAATFGTGTELWHLDAAGTPTLAFDLNPGRPGSDPFALSPIGTGGVAFVADDGSGDALYRIDAPGQAPIRLTPASASLFFDSALKFTQAGTNLFFQADDGASGLELWVSRGAAGDAILLRDIRPGSSRSEISSISVFGNSILFAANDGSHGFEWWVSDGTPAGTQIIQDLNPGGAQGALFGSPLFLGSRAVLAANDGSTGFELWTTDGSPGSMRLFKDVYPGAVGSLPAHIAPLRGGRFMFAADDGQGAGYELWLSDGTAAGTNLFFDINPGSFPGLPVIVAAVPGGLFYRVVDLTSNRGEELLFTDGTVAGTRIFDVNPGSSGSSFYLPVVSGGKMFAGWSPSNVGGMTGLLVSDGTVAGTQILYSNSPRAFAAYAGGRTVFVGNSTNEGAEPWVTDGTAAGTQLLVDLDPFQRTADSRAIPVGRLGGRTIVSADDGNGFAIWATDGTAAGTQPILQTQFFGAIARMADRLLLATTGGLAVTDGTAVGSQVLGANVRGSFGGRRTDALGALVRPGLAVFGGEDAARNFTLWATDGTVAGTREISPTFAIDFTPAENGGLVYFAGPGTTGQSIWKTDGTAAGTVPFFTTGTPPANRDIDIVAEINGKVLFTVFFEIWISDGTAAGTVMLRRNSLNSATVSPAVRLGSRVLFSTIEGAFATDGTVAGTEQLVQTSRSGSQVTTIGGGGLIYARVQGTEGFYVTDGTLAGTRQLPVNFRLRPGDPRSARFVEVTESRRAIAPNMFVGPILVSDGTTSGTIELTPTQQIGQMQPVDGALYFTDSTQYFGLELYAIDLGAAAQAEGTGCGTSPSLRLTSGEPALGTTIQLSAPNAFNATVVLFGAPASLPIPLPGAGCVTWVDLAQSPIAAPAPNGVLSVSVPNLPSLVGVRVMTQAFAGPSSAPLGADASNSLRLVLDR